MTIAAIREAVLSNDLPEVERLAREALSLPPIPAAKPCPKCKGEGGGFEGVNPACPSVNDEWIECPACEGSGEAVEPDECGHGGPGRVCHDCAW